MDTATLPPDLDKLINDQLSEVLGSSSPPVVEGLKFLTASTAPLPLKLLAKLVEVDDIALANGLTQTGIIKYDRNQGFVSFDTEVTRDVCKRRFGSQISVYLQRVIDAIKSNPVHDEFLLTVLLKEAQDYEGLKSLTTRSALLSTMEANHDASRVLARLQLASTMARAQGDLSDVFKWSLGKAVMRSVISYGAEESEIRALIAVGRSQEALRKAYSTPDITSKVRLLARAYSAMKEKGERIPLDAQDELRVMVSDIRTQDLDAEIARGIAVELFPVLPDAAFELLGKVMREQEDRTFIEVAIAEAVINSRERLVDLLGAIKDPNLVDVVRMYSAWLVDLSFEKLVEDVRSLSDTKPKEYMVRQWCQQNPDSDSLVRAVELWLEIVVGDRKYVAPLRSLRQMSEVVVRIPQSDRLPLIRRFDAFRSTGISSPKQEWTRLSLHLAQAMLEIDLIDAQRRIHEIYHRILEDVIEPDIRAHCLAWVWVATRRAGMLQDSLVQEVKHEFEAAFNSLLSTSAEHFELIEGALEAVSTADPDYAFKLAMMQNTRSRRESGIKAILERALLSNPQADLSGFIRQAIDTLSENERDIAVLNISSSLRIHGSDLSKGNISELRAYCEAIKDPSRKAIALANMAILTDDRSCLDNAIISWRAEDDLKVRLNIGFELVEDVAKFDLDMAAALCEEVQRLQLQPGSALASSLLGAVYYEALELAIFSLTIHDLSDAEQALLDLEASVERIPALRMRIQLYAQLAASAYRAGYSTYADEVVRTKVMPFLKQFTIVPDYNAALAFCLSVKSQDIANTF